jgi:hypothetical protein
MQQTMFPHAGGFDVFPSATGFVLVDTDGFNRWDMDGYLFTNEAAAVEYAWRCYDFKTGQRSYIPEPRDCIVTRSPW